MNEFSTYKHLRNVSLRKTGGSLPFLAAWNQDPGPDDLGSGSVKTARFATEAERTYFLRAEEFRAEIAALNEKLEDIRMSSTVMEE